MPAGQPSAVVTHASPGLRPKFQTRPCRTKFRSNRRPCAQIHPVMKTTHRTADTPAASVNSFRRIGRSLPHEPHRLAHQNWAGGREGLVAHTRDLARGHLEGGEAGGDVVAELEDLV